MRILISRALGTVMVFAAFSFAARTVKIENRCSTKVWPAVSPFSEQQEPYGDTRGWEMSPGTSKSITVPNSFHGRIWGRQGCVAQSDGTLVCVTGACPGNQLECEDGALGTGTNLDLRLSSNNNGQYDWYMLTNGGGWSMSTNVKAEGSGCQAVSCAPDLEACPDDKLKLQDSYGATLGCMSACYAGVGDSAAQCCSGDYANAKSCTPDLIQVGFLASSPWLVQFFVIPSRIVYYSYFKSKTCEHAYAYFQDSRTGQPTVDYLCPSDGVSGFVFTFCPDGDGETAASTTARSKTDVEGEMASGDKTTIEDSQPTGTGGGSQPTDIPAITSIASLNATVPESSKAETASSTSGPGSSVASGTSSGGAPSSSATSSASDSAEESTDADEEDTDGLTTTQLYWIAGGGVVLALVVVGLVIFVVRRKHQQRAQTAQQSADMEQAQTAQAGSGRNPAQYAAVRSRSNRSQTALLSDSDQHTESEPPSSSDEEDRKPAQRRASTASRSSRN
ncbi:hypothetical protein JCM11251_002153 [Rhodosporidiobolus azoricus]